MNYNIDYLLVLLVLLLLIILVFLIVAFANAYDKNTPFFKNLFSLLKRHSFLLLFSIPILTLILLYRFDIEDNIESFITTLCYSVVGVGIFSGTLKYINSLVFVKKHFEETILSDKFDEIIKNKFESFVFSDNFLESISDNELLTRWKNITFFKYKKKFPILWEKMDLKKYVENYFFKNDSLDYYYKGFRVHYDIKLSDSDLIEIEQKTDFTVVTNSKRKIELKFWFTNNNSNPTEPTIDKKGTIIDEYSLEDLENNKKNFKEEIVGDRKKMIITLEGKKEYQIEQIIRMTQDYNIDRVRSFISSKIIDDIFIEINCCDNLDFFFEPLNENEFKPDILCPSGNGFKNKNIVMPGELFIMFIDKKDKVGKKDNDSKK